MHATSSQNFGSISIYEEAPETDEKAPQDDDDEDVEIEDEDVKVKNAGKKVRLEEVWREMIVTSNGRDKVFVSYANNSENVNGMINMSLLPRYRRTETDSILNTAGTMVPLFADEQQTASEANTTTMGAEYCFTAKLHCSRIVAHKACFQPNNH